MYIKKLCIVVTLVSMLSVFSLSGQGSIGLETRNLSSIKINLDLKENVSSKVYFSNWSSFQSRDKRLPRFSSYIISQTMINVKVSDRVTVSNGFQYFKDYTYDFKVNAWIMKLDFKLYK